MYSLFVVALILCEGLMLGPCFVLQYFVSFLYSCAIVSLGKRELVALLLLCSECHITVVVL